MTIVQARCTPLLMYVSRSSPASSLARSKPSIAENWKKRVVPVGGQMITIYVGSL